MFAWNLVCLFRRSSNFNSHKKEKKNAIFVYQYHSLAANLNSNEYVKKREH